MSDEITITRKYVIYPIASDMKEWERKVIKYVSENYEKRIQLLEQKIKHSKIPKEEKENLRKELDNLKIKYDAFQADPAITQSEINTYTYGTVRTAMEEEARKKNYILSWIYSEMIGAGVQHVEDDFGSTWSEKTYRCRKCGLQRKYKSWSTNSDIE